MAVRMDVLSSVCSHHPYESSRKIRAGLKKSSEIQCAPREHFTCQEKLSEFLSASELSNSWFLRKENKMLKITGLILEKRT